MKQLLAAMLAINLATLSACSTADTIAATDEQPVAVGAVIAKPKVAVADGAALMSLIRSKLVRPERVAFQRPMSGGAYVINVVAPATSQDIPNVVSDLLATGLFEYVEVDQIVTIQK
jgi:hypothetical protein